MGVIAAQLGHADTRMTEKHYAHLAPSYIAQTVRSNLPTLNIYEGGRLSRCESSGHDLEQPKLQLIGFCNTLISRTTG